MTKSRAEYMRAYRANKLHMVSLGIPKGIYADIKYEASANGMSVAGFIMKLVQEYLDLKE